LLYLLRKKMDHRLVVTYDISNDKLRVNIHKFLKNYGINSQKSVFEMIVSDPEYEKIFKFLNKKTIADKDTVRIYEVCRNCIRTAHRLGEGLDLNLLDFEIID